LFYFIPACAGMTIKEKSAQERMPLAICDCPAP
jgi:hypothetical protein